jgi:hypothetical protein
MVWTNPSSRPHPRKRRFAQGRRDSTAVQILSPDFLGLSNYKAIALKAPAGHLSEIGIFTSGDAGLMQLEAWHFL